VKTLVTPPLGQRQFLLERDLMVMAERPRERSDRHFPQWALIELGRVDEVESAACSGEP
jgi:hypothetical protein